VKLATWNINSIRAREARLYAWLDRERPDVMCLKETKVEDQGFPLDAMKRAGYEVATLASAATTASRSRRASRSAMSCAAWATTSPTTRRA